MFTGIIEDVGRLAEMRDLGGGRRLAIETAFAGELEVDQSVAVNGVCLTVVSRNARRFEAVSVEETLRKTNLGRLVAGSPVNLERAMRPQGRLDGHIVQGHVDAPGTVTRVEREQTGWLYGVRFEERFASWVIPAGSIAIDGISLTVARLDGNELTVAIIPHTWENTNVSGWSAGRTVNLEFDLIGKYVTRWLEVGRTGTAKTGITADWLREQGFER